MTKGSQKQKPPEPAALSETNPSVPKRKRGSSISAQSVAQGKPAGVGREAFPGRCGSMLRCRSAAWAHFRDGAEACARPGPHRARVASARAVGRSQSASDQLKHRRLECAEVARAV